MYLTWIPSHMPTKLTCMQVAKSKSLLSALEKVSGAGQLSRIVVDEAHCCSEYGHGACTHDTCELSPQFRPLSAAFTCISHSCTRTRIHNPHTAHRPTHPPNPPYTHTIHTEPCTHRVPPGLLQAGPPPQAVPRRPHSGRHRHRHPARHPGTCVCMCMHMRVCFSR